VFRVRQLIIVGGVVVSAAVFAGPAGSHPTPSPHQHFLALPEAAPTDEVAIAERFCANAALFDNDITNDPAGGAAHAGFEGLHFGFHVNPSNPTTVTATGCPT
jgi:hypothetical protein